MKNKTDLLLKLQALAERGIGGEQENAAALLEHLMEKCGISEEQLGEEVIIETEFKYWGDLQLRLLKQIIYKVTGALDFYSFRYGHSGRKCRSSLGARCTKAQKIEIEFLFDFCNTLWVREQEAFFSAYIQRHRLYADTPVEGGGKKQISDEEYQKMQQLMSGMDDASPLRRLAAGDPQEKEETK